MFTRVYGNVDFFQKALDGTWARDTAIKKNIANVNTPDYKREIVSFEDQLKGKINERQLKLNTTNEKHFSNIEIGFSPRSMRDKSGSYRIDGNNVDIEVENANMVKNTIMYDALTRQVSGEFDKLKNIITEGSK